MKYFKKGFLSPRKISIIWKVRDLNFFSKYEVDLFPQYLKHLGKGKCISAQLGF